MLFVQRRSEAAENKKIDSCRRQRRVGLNLLISFRSMRLAMLVVIALATFLSESKAQALAFEFGLGIDYTYFTYQEILAAPAKSTETALFPEFVALGRMYFYNDSYLQFRADIGRDVQSQYDGTAFDSGQAVQAIDVLQFTNLELDLYWSLTPRAQIYVGYGERTWNRFLSGGSGYTEVYQWDYTPIGLYVAAYKTEGMEFGVDVSVRPTLNGTINVITSQTYTNGQNSTMNLGSKTGYKLMLPARFNYKEWAFIATPWYEHSEIGQSNLVSNTTLVQNQNAGILEPDSKTDQYGLEADITFTF